MAERGGAARTTAGGEGIGDEVIDPPCEPVLRWILEPLADQPVRTNAPHPRPQGGRVEQA